MVTTVVVVVVVDIVRHRKKGSYGPFCSYWSYWTCLSLFLRSGINDVFFLSWLYTFAVLESSTEDLEG